MVTKKKIIHLSKYSPYNYGGIENYVNNLSKFLKERKINHEILVFSKSKINLENYREIFKYFVIFNTPIFLNFWWFKDHIKKYDIIHLHLPNPIYLFFLTFINLKNKKLIIHWHSDILNFPILKIFVCFFEKKILSQCHTIICTSKSYANASLSLKKYNEKIKIIPLFIFQNSLPKFSKDKKKDDIIKLISVGRLVKYKGYDLLISALKYLPKNYFLNIIGEGPERSNLKKLINNLGIQDRVNLMGKLSENEKYKMYQISDLFILASNSRKEAFGVVLIEAMYYNLPSLTREIEGSGVNEVNNIGYSFEEEDPLGLSKVIISTIDNSKKSKINFFENYLNKYTERSQTPILDIYNNE